jgi:hypothetical protein
MNDQLKSVEEQEQTAADEALVNYVMSHCEKWRDYKDINYGDDWDEFERLYYGIWSDEDKTRDTERSKIISPAIRQAVENKTAEIMEATTGRGEFFDIKDDFADQDHTDVELVKRQLHEDIKKHKVDKAWAEVNRNAEVFGVGFAEIQIKEVTDFVPTTQPIPGMQAAAIGVTEVQRIAVPVKSIHPRNMLWDPNSDTIEEGLGVAVEEYTSLFKVVKGMEDGVYRKVDIGPEYTDTDLEPSQLDEVYRDEKVRILRFYGLVPRKFLEKIEEKDGEVVTLFPDTSEGKTYEDLVEAIVVIGNGSKLLKAEANPYMMKDRPIVCYTPEKVPGRIVGMGTVQKGYNMQKAIDAQLRSHLDSLALTTAPMMAADATRLPRGMSYKVQPGKTLLTNGNPNEILFPFKFGNTDSANISTAREFETMLLQATGTMDSQALTRSVASGEAGGASMSLAMSSIIKKNKQALMTFQDDFLIPLVKKMAYRYMQYDPERYPSQDFSFIPASTLGMVAREYEQQQFVGLLQTLGPDSPIVPIILKGIIKSSSLSNKEELAAQLEQLSQPNPEAQAMQQAQMQAQMQLLQAQAAELASQAQENQAAAAKLATEAQLMPEETRAKVIAALSKNLPNADDAAQQEFDRRVKIAELMLKEADMKNKSKIVEMQMAEKMDAMANIETEFLDKLTERLGSDE